MNTLLRRSLSTVLAALLILAGCEGTPPASVTNLLEGNCIGKLTDEKGAPVPDASVLLVPEGYAPGTQQADGRKVDSTRTDGSGNFALNVTSSGKFNLLASSGSCAALRKSLPLRMTGQMELPDEVLRPAGSLTGSVRLEGVDDYRSALLLLPGTTTYAAADSSGTFTFKALAEGDYDLRVLSMENGFSVVETTVTVVSAKECKLPLIVLPKKREPKLDGFTVTYDSLMMNAVLSWTTRDADIIDSFRIYCNREKNISPIYSCRGNVTSFTIDCISLPKEKYVYQIAPVGKDGWEGQALVGSPFVNTSVIKAENVVIPELSGSVRLFFGPKFHFTPSGRYLIAIGSRTDFSVFKFSTEGAIEKSILLSSELDDVSNIASDSEGNLYFCYHPARNLPFIDSTVNLDSLYRSMPDNMILLKCDKNLNLVDKYEFPCESGPHFYTLAVSSNGQLMLYNTNGLSTFPRRDGDSTWVRDSTRVTIFGSDLEVVSETFITDCREIVQTGVFNDTTIAIIRGNGWTHDQIWYFDNSFKVIKTIDLQMIAPAGYQRGTIIQICDRNLFVSGIEGLLVFYSGTGNIIARYPIDGECYVDYFFSDGHGHLYSFERDGNRRYLIGDVIWAGENISTR